MTQLDLLIFPKRSSIGLIKIDVGGFELKALKGASQLISKHKPVIIIEQNGLHMENEHPFSALDYLKEINYKVVDCKFNREGRLTDLILIYDR